MRKGVKGSNGLQYQTGSQLRNLKVEECDNKYCRTIREIIKTSAKESLCCYELKKHKPWFDEGC
jgi:hypothetical protein